MSRVLPRSAGCQWLPRSALIPLPVPTLANTRLQHLGHFPSQADLWMGEGEEEGKEISKQEQRWPQTPSSLKPCSPACDWDRHLSGRPGMPAPTLTHSDQANGHMSAHTSLDLDTWKPCEDKPRWPVTDLGLRWGTGQHWCLAASETSTLGPLSRGGRGLGKDGMKLGRGRDGG